ncbi:MAG: tetratricopeptide repeat protein [Deltaproteobacteria bacterium]|nr:tetratricopeptide repeat protein [Deltaproteobacteria bacterium]
MGKNKASKNIHKPQPATQKRVVGLETMLIVVVIALVVGFVAGEIMGRSGSNHQAKTPQPIASVSAPPPMSPAPSDAAEIERQQKIATAHPGDAQAWIELGNLYFDNHRVKEAIQAYNKALELSPYNVDVWTDLGIMYRRDGRFFEAIGAFNRVLDINQTHEQALFNKGIVLMHDLGDQMGGITAWEALLQANPSAKTADGRSIRVFVDHMKKELSGKSP